MGGDVEQSFSSQLSLVDLGLKHLPKTSLGDILHKLTVEHVRLVSIPDPFFLALHDTDALKPVVS